MPAAAVIPAPIASIKVVAVKKLVVGSLAEDSRSALAGEHLNGPGHFFRRLYLLFIVWSGIRKFYVKEIKKCFRHAFVGECSSME